MPNPGMDRARTSSPPSPPLVAVAGWLLPGAGYWLIGERARGLTVGVTIIALFLLGILLGGVRAIQVPGYGENGGRLHTWFEGREGRDGDVVSTGNSKVDEEPPYRKHVRGPWIATDFRALLRDIGNKPWSICQVLTGPVALAGGAWSVSASRPVEKPDGTKGPAGVLSHSRINDIAVLYTAVAGLLNLMVIIDAAARAAGSAAPARPTVPAGPSSSGQAARPASSPEAA